MRTNLVRLALLEVRDSGKSLKEVRWDIGETAFLEVKQIAGFDHRQDRNYCQSTGNPD